MYSSVKTAYGVIVSHHGHIVKQSNYPLTQIRIVGLLEDGICDFGYIDKMVPAFKYRIGNIVKLTYAVKQKCILETDENTEHLLKKFVIIDPKFVSNDTINSLNNILQRSLFGYPLTGTLENIKFNTCD